MGQEGETEEVIIKDPLIELAERLEDEARQRMDQSGHRPVEHSSLRKISRAADIRKRAEEERRRGS